MWEFFTLVAIISAFNDSHVALYQHPLSFVFRIEPSSVLYVRNFVARGDEVLICEKVAGVIAVLELYGLATRL